ncbi:unnamed protein product, partial [Staurois parvus]
MGPYNRLLMLLPGPECLMGSLYGLPLLLNLHRHTLPCATFRSPHTAGVIPFFVIGCWQITGRPPIAAARPLICHGPLYRLLMLLARSRVSHGSLYGLPLLLSLHRHTLPCATFRSPHTLLVCFHFL